MHAPTLPQTPRKLDFRHSISQQAAQASWISHRLPRGSSGTDLTGQIKTIAGIVTSNLPFGPKEFLAVITTIERAIDGAP